MKKANYIKKFIIQYYDKYKRSLPWRSKNNSLQDPYCTLISEIMLQQTRVDKVKVFYESFLRKWPNIYALSCADISQILTHWSGLGYYRRAINLHKTSKIIANVYSGIIPADKETLKSLPGIGEYTSSAIISFAFGKYSIILDTNIKRFIMRIFGLKDDIKEKDLIKKQVKSWSTSEIKELIYKVNGLEALVKKNSTNSIIFVCNFVSNY